MERTQEARVGSSLGSFASKKEANTSLPGVQGQRELILGPGC